LDNLKAKGNCKSFIKYDIGSEETEILDGAMKLMCMEPGISLQIRARLSRKVDLNSIVDHAKGKEMHLIGPVVQLELLDQSCKFKSLQISLRHFLVLPLAPEFARDSPEDVSQVVKLSSDGRAIDEIITGTFRKIETEYFSFVEENHFCWYASFGLWSCKHAFKQIFVISQHRVGGALFTLKI